ncbi:SGNH hydrolase-type esterase domain containing protein [Naviculisporaceae sp. PSN 640]
MASSLSSLLLLLVSLTPAIALPPPTISPPTSPNIHGPPLLVKRGSVEKTTTDHTKFDWIHRWAAIGDSFTAGIGSGTQLGTYLTEAWKCSRYSYSWPKIVNKALGPAVQNFQFPACSGARTEQIRQQAANLAGNLDLVMMTAGGNDLCLAAMIRECVFLPYRGEQACQDVIDKAQLNIDTILKPNLQTILDELDDKMKDDSILVFNGYAPFFNTENEDCADAEKHDWAFKEWWSLTYWTHTALPLTTTRREKFNTLVNNINNAIKEVVEENDGTKPYRIVYGDWADLPDKIDGQMCSPRSSGHYPDPDQEGLLFFKPDTHVHEGHIGLRRRSENGTLTPEEAALFEAEKEREAKQHAQWHAEQEAYAREMKARYPHNEDLYDSLIFRSPNPDAEALHKLDPRSASPPNCPGDGNTGIVGEAAEVLGLGLPDSFLSNFHPNQKGHEAIAAVAIDSMIHMRAHVLEKPENACRVKQNEEFICNGIPKPGKPHKAHIPYKYVEEAHDSFCGWTDFPTNSKDWTESRQYHTNTIDQFVIRVTTKTPSHKTKTTLDYNFCKESLKRIIDGCDGGDRAANPLNMKFGGKYVRRDGEYTFEIIPAKEWARPLAKRHEGRCNSHYHVFHSEYVLVGSGWGGNSRDQDKVMWAFSGCGAALNYKWDWTYCTLENRDEVCEGYDWKFVWQGLPLVKARCWDNLTIAKAAGGYYHKYKKKYEDYGCAGSDR